MRILTGIDIIRIKRFEKQNQQFLDRCFTATEQEYCFSTVKPAEHFAGRFAAKEAIIKAFSAIESDFHDMKLLEIRKLSSGRPIVKYLGNNPILKQATVDISISHDGEYAVASAVVFLATKNLKKNNNFFKKERNL